MIDLYFTALGSPFFPSGPELWHHPLAYSTAGELQGTLQHATLVHPALHPQVPVRSYLWLSADKALEPPTSAPMHVSDTWWLYSYILHQASEFHCFFYIGALQKIFWKNSKQLPSLSVWTVISMVEHKTQNRILKRNITLDWVQKWFCPYEKIL